jgi:predicted short-subunit dehydrogenase-like oxidoreductase (DUF2520 family)
VITFRTIGPGRAGRSLTAALEAAGGFASVGSFGRGQPVAGAARDIELLVIATPDGEVGGVAAAVDPNDHCVVVHLSGSLGLGVLDGHPRRGSLHPLVPLPNPAVGAARLRAGVTFAVAGDPMVGGLVRALGGRAVRVDDSSRTAYHAAAAIAANHLVALIGQVDRVAATAGLPLDAFAGLVRAATEDALTLGPRHALTGPAVRGDWETVDRHRSVLSSMPAHRTELAAYDAMVGLARRLSLGTADEPGAASAGHTEPDRADPAAGDGRAGSAVGAEQVA